MAKEKVRDYDNSTVNDGSHAIRRFTFGDFLIMLILVILCLTCILPFIHLAAKSVSSNTAVMQRAVVLWPIGLNFDAYSSIFQDGTLVRSFLYSVMVVAIFTLLGMITCTCAAYPLSKKRLKGRAFFTILLMIPMYFNAGLIPTYLLYKDLRLLNNMWVLILPLIYSSYNMLIMKNYFQSTIPDTLEEAAFLDGANNFQILFRIAINYQSDLKYIEVKRNAIEESIRKTTKREDLFELHELESNLVYFKTSLSVNASIIDRISRQSRLISSSEDRELIDDVIVETNQALEMTTTYAQIIKGTRQLVEADLNNSLAGVMRFLTSITLIISIPTMIASFYGMNVELPGGSYEYMFAVLIILMIILCVISVWILKKKGMWR